MTDRHALLEADLRELAADLDGLVAGRDVSGAVVTRIAARRRQPKRRRLLAAAIVGALVIGAVPPARAAVTRIVRVGVDHIHSGAPPRERRAAARPNLTGLGERMTLAGARTRMPAVVVPSLAGLGAPDSVWYAPRGAGQVTLLYRHDHVVVQEFLGNGRVAVEKYIEYETTAEPVRVGGDDAVFIRGGKHVVWYRDASGAQVTEYGRLVGDALVFQRGPLTIRIESDIGRDRLIALAASLR